MNQISSALAKYSGKLLGFIATIIGLLSFFIPTLYSWVKFHGLHVLAGAIIFELFTLVYFNQVATSKRKITTNRRDLMTIEKLLDGWTIESSFYKYLSKQADHKRFDRKYSNEIEEHCIAWQYDLPNIFDKKLRIAFEETKRSLSDYRVSQLEMKAVGSAPRSSHIYNENILEVPAEWELNDYDRYNALLNKLNTGCEKLVLALKDLFSLIEKMQIANEKLN